MAKSKKMNYNKGIKLKLISCYVDAYHDKINKLWIKYQTMNAYGRAIHIMREIESIELFNYTLDKIHNLKIKPFDENIVGLKEEITVDLDDPNLYIK